MKKLVSATFVLTLSVCILIASTASAHAATVRTGDDRLTIPNSSPCRANRPIMEGMVAGAGGQLYIIFSGGSAETPVLSRWVRDGSAWDATSWTCTGPPTVMPELGHGNDLAYNPDYLGQGPALIAAQGSQTAYLDDDVTIVHLGAGGVIGATQVVDLPMNISGLCYSPTAAGGAGKYAARRLGSMWTHASSGGLGSGWTLVESNLTTHDNRSDQGMDCSANYVWSTKSINGSTPQTGWNWVYQYNWSGGDVESDIGIPGNNLNDEIEDITHVGGEFFVGINRNDGEADSVRVLIE